MTTTVNREDLRKLNEETVKPNDQDTYKYLNDVIDGMKDNVNIQVRKVVTANKVKLRIYRYDRYLYRFNCEKVISLNY